MQTPPPAMGRSRRFKIVLIASLALNLLFIGLIAGAAYRFGGPGGDRAGPPISGYAAPYVRALPKAERRALYQQLRQEGALPQRGARRDFYRQMLIGLRAEPFDPGTVQDVLRAQSQSLEGVLAASQQAWLNTVSQMSADGRQAYADALEAQLERRNHRSKRRRTKE